MKIPASFPPSATGAQPPQTSFGEDPERQANGFADLLAALLTNAHNHNAQRHELPFALPASHPADKTRAPDFAPQIGAHGRAFARARLLVQTALEFPGFDEAGTAIRSAEVLHSQTRRPAHPPGAPTADDASINLMKLLAQVACAAPAGQVASVAASTTSSPLTIVPDSTGAARVSPAQENPRVARTEASNRSVIIEKTPGPDAPLPRPDGRATPFGAQLLAFDGGLRLLLRLPQLADGERGELEARLARLLESFGHRNHDIVIYEIAKGRS